MCLFVSAQDSSDCKSLIVKITFERLWFGTVFSTERGAGFWRHWGHSLKTGRGGTKFHLLRFANSCANLRASVEVERNWVYDGWNFGAVGEFLQVV